VAKPSYEGVVTSISALYPINDGVEIGAPYFTFYIANPAPPPPAGCDPNFYLDLRRLGASAAAALVTAAFASGRPVKLGEIEGKPMHVDWVQI
jgi:hypothetical protein